MPMHPALEQHALLGVLELLFGADPEAALAGLRSAGFIDAGNLPRWQAELARPQYRRGRDDLVATAKLMLDPLAAASGKLSCKEPLAVLGNLQPLLAAAGRLIGPGPALEGATVLDYGAGIFYSLSSAVILYANGCREAIAYEPFALQRAHIVASLHELLRAMLVDPARFCLFGQSPLQLKTRLASLELGGVEAGLQALEAGESEDLSLGGVRLIKSRAALAPASVDLVFSNSVLEHVDSLADELAWQRQLLRPQGLCCHTVDFVDHRHYYDRSVHPLAMYGDGVLDGINGLRPSQMEALFLAAGFECLKMQRLSLPAALHLPAEQSLAPRFAALSRHDFYEWINGYVLRPR